MAFLRYSIALVYKLIVFGFALETSGLQDHAYVFQAENISIQEEILGK